MRKGDRVEALRVLEVGTVPAGSRGTVLRWLGDSIVELKFDDRDAPCSSWTGYLRVLSVVDRLAELENSP